jgi:hypothetical protein
MPEFATVKLADAMRHSGPMPMSTKRFQYPLEPRLMRGENPLSCIFARTVAAWLFGVLRKRPPLGRRRVAVNLRLTEPDPIAKLPIERLLNLPSLPTNCYCT